MSQIEISCIGSDAIFTNTPNIFSGGNVDSVKFKFDKDWDGFTGKTAVFYTNPKETALQILDSNNVAKIPAEMIANKGKLSIGVIGTRGADGVKTSKILTYIVGKGAVTDDMEVTSPTPNIWLQLLSIVEHNKQIVDNMELVVDESQMTNKANKDLSNVAMSTVTSKGIARISVGSYTGTGTFGSDNPNVLTFDFEPKLVLIANPEGSVPIISLMRGCQKYVIAKVDSYGLGYVNWTGTSVSWYSTSSTANAHNQGNQLNVVYRYIALG